MDIYWYPWIPEVFLDTPRCQHVMLCSQGMQLPCGKAERESTLTGFSGYTAQQSAAVNKTQIFL